jgi:hypothetical protein
MSDEAAGNGHHAEHEPVSQTAEAEPRSVLEPAPEDANADGLTLYSPDRFVAAAQGAIPVADFVEEVVAHVERQLPRPRRQRI